MEDNGNGQTTSVDISKLSFSIARQSSDLLNLIINEYKPHSYLDQDGALVLEWAGKKWRFMVTIEENPAKSYWLFLTLEDGLNFSGSYTKNFEFYLLLVRRLIHFWEKDV